MIDYDFEHHDALEDAKAAGQVLLAACAATGLSVEDWLVRVERHARRTTSQAWPRQAISPGRKPRRFLNGEVIVFTGALEIPRSDAAALAAEVGCRVASTVSKKVTLLVVGDQDVAKLARSDQEQ